ncbi:MAG: hypothetical protein ACLPX5_06230 [Dissulfurispiraceae bacterium]
MPNILIMLQCTTCKSHGSVPDTNRKLFRKEILEKAKSKGFGWVDYVYLNPETNDLEYKTTYLLKVGDIMLCCGVYSDYSHEGD